MHNGTLVFNDTEFTPLVAIALAGEQAAGLVAVLRRESDGTVLVGEPVLHDYRLNPDSPLSSDSYDSLYGGMFTYWINEHDLSGWSEIQHGPIQF